MKQGTKIAIIVVASLILAIVIALILYFTLRPKVISKIPLKEEANVELRQVIKNSFNGIIKLMSSVNVPIPDIYSGCSGSTINRIKFCGNLKYGGTLEVGGIAPCEVAYRVCRTPCDIACAVCKPIPLIPCGGPCNDCPNSCKSIRDHCIRALSAEWSVNVLEAFDIGNTMSVSDFREFNIFKYRDDYILFVTLVVAMAPKANVDIRTTASIGNYQGAVGLGNLQTIITLQLYYDCTTKQTRLVKLEKIEVYGIDVNFNFPNASDFIKRAIYSVAKSKIDDKLKEVLEDKLTSIFDQFIRTELLPRLQLPIPC